MNKSPKTFINHSPVVLIPAIFCLLAIQSTQAKEPYFDGKPLSQWLCCEPRNDEEKAVRQIGSNAIPTLLDILGATDKTAKRVAARLDNKSIQHNVSSDDFKIDDFQAFAVDGFRILGTNAESAIPKIVKLLDKEETSFNAAQALAVVGPNGFAALTNYLATGSMRGSVVMALGQKGGGDPQLVTQLLIAALKDGDPGIRVNAADLLAGRDPNIAIPALIEALDDKNPDARRWAATSLGSYGSNARAAAPQILTLYTNAPDVFIFQTLQKIDPETAGKAEEFILNSGPLGLRNGYTKTLLKSGKELIAGGWLSASIINPSNRCLSKCELLDPVTGKWTGTGEMNAARDGHMAILLKNGNVLVVGGSNGKSNLSSAELYDPVTGKWTTTAPMHHAYYGCKASLNFDGSVLVYLAPYNSPIVNLEQYDPATEKWSVITNLTQIPK